MDYSVSHSGSADDLSQFMLPLSHSSRSMSSSAFPASAFPEIPGAVAPSSLSSSLISSTLGGSGSSSSAPRLLRQSSSVHEDLSGYASGKLEQSLEDIQYELQQLQRRHSESLPSRRLHQRVDQPQAPSSSHLYRESEIAHNFGIMSPVSSASSSASSSIDDLASVERPAVPTPEQQQANLKAVISKDIQWFISCYADAGATFAQRQKTRALAETIASQVQAELAYPSADRKECCTSAITAGLDAAAMLISYRAFVAAEQLLLSVQLLTQDTVCHHDDAFSPASDAHAMATSTSTPSPTTSADPASSTPTLTPMTTASSSAQIGLEFPAMTTRQLQLPIPSQLPQPMQPPVQLRPDQPWGYPQQPRYQVNLPLDHFSPQQLFFQHMQFVHQQAQQQWQQPFQPAQRPAFPQAYPQQQPTPTPMGLQQQRQFQPLQFAESPRSGPPTTVSTPTSTSHVSTPAPSAPAPAKVVRPRPVTPPQPSSTRAFRTPPKSPQHTAAHTPAASTPVGPPMNRKHTAIQASKLEAASKCVRCREDNAEEGSMLCQGCIDADDGESDTFFFRPPKPLPNGKIPRHCENCGCVSTPTWRRGPGRMQLCNACGIYYKQQQTLRPVALLHRRAAVRKTSSSGPNAASSAGKQRTPSP